MRVRHGAAALDIADDLTVIVADLQAARARIVDVPESLAVLIRDRQNFTTAGVSPGPYFVPQMRGFLTLLFMCRPYPTPEATKWGIIA